MKTGDFDHLGQLSMRELFRAEAESQTALLTSGLLELERGPALPQQLETLMRAAHSIKGAARIVNLDAAVRVAHAMEDCFVAAQHQTLQIRQPEIDALLRAVDLLHLLCKDPDAEAAARETAHGEDVRNLLSALRQMQNGQSLTIPPVDPGLLRPDQSGEKGRQSLPSGTLSLQPSPSQPLSGGHHEAAGRVVRLTAENLNRLLALAGESLVEARWLRPFAISLQRLKRPHAELSQQLDHLRQLFEQENLSERTGGHLHEMFRTLSDCQQFLAQRMEEFDVFERRSAQVSHRLYLEVLRTRMRPFADGARRFPRMVRDLARTLGKNVRLEVTGENTQVDRDILDRLEASLTHLLRNAVDHGCEIPSQRQALGKAHEGLVRLEARHAAGMLQITVVDDGAGVDAEQVRRSIIQKKLTLPAVAQKLNESELLEFLFLPGFTLRDTVTEISGRGFGLDVVQNMVKSVRGTIRLVTQPGQGMRVQIQLPITLSVLRALLVEIAGEPYAIPLTQVARTLKLGSERIETLEGRHHFLFDGQQVGLLSAHQVLECGEPRPSGQELSVVVVGDRNARYGLVVDRFLGERELVVRPLDPRLGKVKDISAAALTEDGAPILILDVDDMIHSIEKLVSAGLIDKVQGQGLHFAPKKQKRVLAVDDSLTVRELERKLLTSRGYFADVAVDGIDGWNAVRTGHYDLVVTDVDMPRMDGIELATLIKKDPGFKSLPVMIVSYKEGEEDRMRGLEAGADYYLTKGSFHDETLLQAVADLIGEPDA